MSYRRVAAMFLLRDDGAALMQHRDDKPEIPHANTWVPPGGHCEDGESVEACVRREFFEETSYRLGDVHLIADFVDDHATGFPPLQLTVFWSRYDGIQRTICHEGQALQFVARERAEAHAVPAYLVELWDRAIEASARTGAVRS